MCQSPTGIGFVPFRSIERYGTDCREFSSQAMDLWAYQNGVKIDFSRPGKSTDNAFVQSFNGTFRAGCLDAHWFDDLDEAKRIIEDWLQVYNGSRPHRSLDR
jgi:putative transposase